MERTKIQIFETIAEGDMNPRSLDCESGILPLSYRTNHVIIVELHLLLLTNNNTVKPRYNAVAGRHLLGPRYKRGAL